MKSNKNDDFDINDDAFLSEDDDFMSQGLEDLNDEKPVKKAARLVFDSTKAVGTGFLKGIKSALGYSVDGFDEAYDNIVNLGEDIYGGITESIDEGKKAIITTRRAMLAALPYTKSLAPKKLYAGVENLLKKNLPEAENEESEETRNQKMQNDQISSTIVDVFRESQQLEESRSLADANERNVVRMIDQHNHKQNISIMSSIARHSQRIAKFLGTTYTSYLKKDLELKYRSYFTAKDTLRYVKALSSTFEQKLEAIKINTGLPDQIKIDKNDSIIKKRNKNNRETLSEFSRSVGSKLSKNVVNLITENVKSLNNDILPMVQTAAETLGSMADLDDITWKQAIDMTAGFAVNHITDFILRRKLVSNPKLANIVKIMRGDAKAINAGFSTASGAFKKFFSNAGLDVLAQLVPEHERSTRTGDNVTVHNPDAAATFDNLVHDSITIAIPKHLERIGNNLEALTESLGVNVTIDHMKAWDPTNPLHLSNISDISKRSYERKYGSNTDQGRFTAIQKAKTKEILKASLGINEDVDISNDSRWKEFEDNWQDFADTLTKIGATGKGVDYKVLRKFAGLKEGKLSYYDDEYLRSIFGSIDDKALTKAKLLLKAISSEAVDKDGDVQPGYINEAALTKLKEVIEQYGNRAETVSRIQDKEHKLGLDAYDKYGIYYDKKAHTFNVDNAISDRELAREGELGDIEYTDYRNRRHILKKKDILNEIKGSASWAAWDLKDYDKTLNESIFDKNIEGSIASKIEEKQLYKKYGFNSTEEMLHAASENGIPGVRTLMTLLGPSISAFGIKASRGMGKFANKLKDKIQDLRDDFTYGVDKIVGKKTNAIIYNIEQRPIDPYHLMVNIRGKTDDDLVDERPIPISIPYQYRDRDVDESGQAKGLSYKEAKKIVLDYLKADAWYKNYHFSIDESVEKNWNKIQYQSSDYNYINSTNNIYSRYEQEMEKVFPTGKKDKRSAEIRKTAEKSSVISILDSIDINVRYLTDKICGKSYSRIDEAKKEATKAASVSLKNKVKPNVNITVGNAKGNVKANPKQENKSGKSESPKAEDVKIASTKEQTVEEEVPEILEGVIEEDSYCPVAVTTIKSPYNHNSDVIIDDEVVEANSDQKKKEKEKKNKFGSFIKSIKEHYKQSWQKAKEAFNNARNNSDNESTEDDNADNGPTVESAKVEFDGEPESRFHSDFRKFADQLLTILPNLKPGITIGGGLGAGISSIGDLFKKLGKGGLNLAKGALSGASVLALGTLGLVPGILRGGSHLLFGNSETGSRGLLRNGADILFGNEALGKSGIVPNALKFGKNVLFGNQETGSRGIIGKSKDILFGKDGDPGIVQKGAKGIKNFLFGNEETGSKGLIKNTKNILFGDPEKDTKGLIPGIYGAGKNFLFGNEEEGTTGLIGKLSPGFKNLKSRLFGGEDSKGINHVGIVRKTINFTKRLFGIDGPKYVDVYRKDDMDLGHCLLKISEQEAGVFLADEQGGIGPKLERSRDIDRPVLKANGDTIIKQEDVDAGLVDKDGNSIYDPKRMLLTKLFSGARRLLGKVGRKIKGALGRFFKVSDDDEDNGTVSKSTFLGRRIGFTPNGPFQDKVLEYLDAISKKIGAEVKPNDNVKTNKTAKPKENKKEDTSKSFKETISSKINEVKSKVKNTSKAFSGLSKVRMTDDELYALGYNKIDDDTWIDGSGNELPKEALYKDGKIGNKTKSIKSKLSGFSARVKAKSKETAEAAKKAMQKKLEVANNDMLDKAGFVQTDADFWTDIETGEVYSTSEAIKIASKKVIKSKVKNTSNRVFKSPIAKIKSIFKRKKPEDFDPAIDYSNVREEVRATKKENMTPYEKRMVELTEANLATAKATQTATEKTAEETAKANEEPDINGTVEENGSAAQQQQKAEEANEKLKKKLKEREAKRNKDKDSKDKKSDKEKNKKEETDEDEPSWLGKYTKQISDIIGKKFKLFGVSTLRKFGLTKAARAFSKGGTFGLLKHGADAGLAALGGGSSLAGLAALGMGAAGGGLGFAGSKSSGASKLSNIVSSGAGTIAGLTALTNPVTASIAAGVMAANSMREGWNDDATLKKTWGGSNVKDYKKGATAAGNLLNYASFGLLNKLGGRKYVDKAMEYSPIGHMVGGVGGAIAGLGDTANAVSRVFKGEDSEMDDLELKRARAKLSADIKRGIKGSQEASQRFEEAVAQKNWRKARRLSKQSANAGKHLLSGIKRTAKGALAVATFGVSSFGEMMADKLIGEKNKPMDEKELTAARKKLEILRKKGSPGIKELETKFEEAVAGENWATARKLVKMEDKGILTKLFSRFNAKAGLIGALAGGGVGGLVSGFLFGKNDETPLSEKEISDFRKRCEIAINKGNKPAQNILDRFDDAVTMQDWKKARKISNMKDKSIADVLGKAAYTATRYLIPAGWFMSDQDTPMTEEEIESFRKKMEYLKSQGDISAQAKLDKFEVAVMKQEWAVARKISRIKHKSVMGKISNTIYDVVVGDEDKPMSEDEIQTFIDSMNRKIELGDTVAQKRLDKFQDAVGKQQWRLARQISDKRRDGIFAKAAKGLRKTGKNLLYYGTGKFLFNGDDDKPMSDSEISKFRDHMASLIEQGNPTAKHRLDQFEDAVLDGSWKRARAIANVKDTGLVQKAAKWAVNLFNSKVKDIDDKETDESDIAQRYRLILSRVKEAMYKKNVDAVGHRQMALLRNEMQDTDLNDLTDEQLDEWSKRLEEIDKACGDLSSDSAKEYEAERKKKQDLVTQQQNLLKEIVASQDRCGIFDSRRFKLKKLFAEVEAIPLEELDKDILDSYDEDLRLIDKFAVSTKSLDETTKTKVKTLLKRQTALTANIDEAYKNANYFNRRSLNKLRDEVTSSLIEELDNSDFDEWDAELKDIDSSAKSSKIRSSGEMKKFKKLIKKKLKLKSMIEEAKKKTSWINFGKRSNLGKIIDDILGTDDEELDDDTIAGWEEDYKSADSEAKTVDEAEQEDKEFKTLLRNKRKLRMSIRKTIRKHRKDDVGWFQKDIAKACQGLVNKLDAIDDEDFTPEMLNDISERYAELDAAAAEELGFYKKDKEEVKQERTSRSFFNPESIQKGWYNGSQVTAPDKRPTLVGKQNEPIDRYGKMMGRKLKSRKAELLESSDATEIAKALANQSVETAISSDDIGRITDVSKGDMFSVAAPMKKGGSVMHNHPDGSSTSLTDIASAKSAGLDNLITIRPKFNKDVIGRVSELNSSNNKYTLNSVYKPDSNSIELKPDIGIKKIDVGNAIAESIDFTKDNKQEISNQSNDDIKNLVGNLTEKVGSIDQGINALGNGSMSQDEMLRGIFERLGDIISAIGEHNVKVNNNIGTAARETFNSMKRYADFEFKKEDHTPPKPITKQSAINISK